MNKKGDGIDFFGMVIALLFVIMIFHWAGNHDQRQHNKFCLKQGFDYGEETVRNTVIICGNLNDNEQERFDYDFFEQSKKLEVGDDETNNETNKTVVERMRGMFYEGDEE